MVRHFRLVTILRFGIGAILLRNHKQTYNIEIYARLLCTLAASFHSQSTVV